MLKRVNAKLLMSISLALVFTFIASFPWVSADETEPFSNIQEKLAGVSEEERATLQNLFTLTQEIDTLEIEEAETTQEIDTLKQEVLQFEAAIASEESAYEKNRDALKQVLKSYQRMGPGSYLEIILNSDSLGMLLRRLNTLRDLTRNTGSLMAALEENKKKLSSEKATLTDKLALMEQKQLQLKTAIADKLKLKEDKETFLESLKEDKTHFEELLNTTQQAWSELKAFFPEAAKEFSRIIDEGSLPSSALEMSFSFFEISGSLSERTLNDIIKGNSLLSEMNFKFCPDEIQIEVPKANLVLSGSFVVIDGHTLKLEIDKGSFYEMPLEAGSIEELFREGNIVLELKPLLGDNILHSVEMGDGYLKLHITPAYLSTIQGGGKK